MMNGWLNICSVRPALNRDLLVELRQDIESGDRDSACSGLQLRDPNPAAQGVFTALGTYVILRERQILPARSHGKPTSRSCW